MRRLLYIVVLLAPFQIASARPEAPLSPMMFVDQVYEAEIAGKRPEADMKLFAPELASLIARDTAIATRAGEPNLIDYDIICSCQDADGLRAVPTVVQQTTTAAIVRVRLTYGGNHPKVVTMKLQRLPRGWLIADIITTGPYGGSLLANLRDGLSGKLRPAVTRPVDNTPDGCAKPGEEVQPAAENCKDVHHVTQHWRVAAATNLMNWPSDQAYKVASLHAGDTIVTMVSVRIGSRTWLEVQKPGEYFAWVRQEVLQPLP